MSKLPDELRDSDEAKLLSSIADHKVYNIVHLIDRSKHYEGHSKDYEFSRLRAGDPSFGRKRKPKACNSRNWRQIGRAGLPVGYVCRAHSFGAEDAVDCRALRALHLSFLPCSGR